MMKTANNVHKQTKKKTKNDYLTEVRRTIKYPPYFNTIGKEGFVESGIRYQRGKGFTGGLHKCFHHYR